MGGSDSKMKHWCDVMKKYGVEVSSSENYFMNQFPVDDMSNSWEEDSGGERVPAIGSHVCGLNALNICLLSLGYGYQLDVSEYPHKYLPWPLDDVKWGLSEGPFYKHCIKPNFNSHHPSWGDKDPLPYLKTVDYTCNLVIALVEFPSSKMLHYIVICGLSRNKTHFLVTDQRDEIYCISAENLKMLMRITVPTFDDYSFFRVA